ncbi:MAG: DUF2490 domain-containing protein [Candidatus Omnitrophica bacterium]|nr:DUF2490 domain-containing protein [Candidatus Omnitrophota bacterium]
MRPKAPSFLLGSLALIPIFMDAGFICPVYSEDENNLRINEVLLIPFCELDGIGETVLRLENEDRWEGSLDDYFYHKNEFNLRVPVPSMKGLNWETGFRRRDGEAGGENTYLFNLTWNRERVAQTDWELRVRHQWELNDPDGESDWNWKGRMRLLLVRDIPWLESGGESWKLGLSEEFFWKPEESGIDENQLGAGVQVPLSRQSLIQFGAYWQRLESSGVGSSSDDNFILKLSFHYHIPSRAKRAVERPVFNEDLHKEF